jgi:hypothetical protein
METVSLRVRAGPPGASGWEPTADERPSATGDSAAAARDPLRQLVRAGLRGREPGAADGGERQPEHDEREIDDAERDDKSPPLRR